MVYKCKKCGFECGYQETFHQHEDECETRLHICKTYGFGEKLFSEIEDSRKSCEHPTLIKNVHHPKHYQSAFSCPSCGLPIECITIARNFNFNLGNVIKYIWRAGKKTKEEPVEDLEKAMWYLFDEINHQSPGAAFDWAKKKLEEIGYEVSTLEVKE